MDRFVKIMASIVIMFWLLAAAVCCIGIAVAFSRSDLNGALTFAFSILVCLFMAKESKVRLYP